MSNKEWGSGEISAEFGKAAWNLDSSAIEYTPSADAASEKAANEAAQLACDHDMPIDVMEPDGRFKGRVDPIYTRYPQCVAKPETERCLELKAKQREDALTQAHTIFGLTP